MRTNRVWYKPESDSINENDENGDDDGVKTRTLLIKFLHWDKKMEVLKGWEALREVDIRIDDDPTRRQRKALQYLSARDKYGHYYRGAHSKIC